MLLAVLHTTPWRAGALVVAVAAACSAVHAADAKRKEAPTDARAPDPYLALVVCRTETQRNAKLYALRAHGILLMRASDRAQGRSSQGLEDQLDLLRQSTVGRASAQKAVERAHEVVTTLTEITVQEPVFEQVASAERLADQAGDVCGQLMGELRAAPPAAQAELMNALTEMLFVSQRMTRRYLAAPLTQPLTAAQRAPVLADAQAFEKQLALLRERAASDGALANAVRQIEGQWIFQRTALDKPRANKSALEYAGRVSESLHEILWSEWRRLRSG
jgi:hypothetical protein